MILRILVMVLRIPVTIVNALWVVFGFITIFGSFGSFVTEPSGAGQLCVALWLLLAWPILNIIAIWWRTQSRARWRKVIPLVATIVNGLTIVFFLVFLLGGGSGTEQKTWEEGYAYIFSIWGTLNIMAIWCGRLKLKRKAVQTSNEPVSQKNDSVLLADDSSTLRKSLVKPHRGELVLAHGIIALALPLPGWFLSCGIGTVVACICGTIAWVMGHKDMKEMDAGRMDPSARGLTKAGKICGMIGVIISIAIVAIQLILIAVMTGLQD